MNSRTLCALALLATGAAASTAHAVGTVFAIDLRATPNRLLSFPANAPAQNVVSANAGFDGFAMDFNASATALYGITTTGSFGTISTTTGNHTPIANVTGATGSFTGLSVAPDNTFYVSTNVAAGTNNLYTLDPTTGAASFVGAITAGTGAINIDIAIDSTGQMYGHDIAADTLLRINKANGVASVIGPTGYLSNFAQGMDFDWDTDTLYATIYTGGGTGVYASFNLATGAGTTIASTTSWNAEMEMAINSPIPEPTSLALLGLGGLAALRRRR